MDRDFDTLLTNVFSFKNVHILRLTAKFKLFNVNIIIGIVCMYVYVYFKIN